jgi:ParB family chromosome partitioning protein
MRKPKPAEIEKTRRTAQVLKQTYETVAVADLKPHPKNPRKSDNAAIDRSIAENGFYGAVYAQRSTGLILAGTHRWQRAQAAGIPEIPVIWLDVDDRRALKILAVDNRVVDRAGYDDQALSELLTTILSECGSLDGSGYVPQDMDKIISEVSDQIIAEENQRTAPAEEFPDEPQQPAAFAGIEYLVIIRCKDEEDQAQVIERLSSEGLDCRTSYAESEA